MRLFTKQQPTTRQPRPVTPITPTNCPDAPVRDTNETLYERIAQGNALAEAEEQARRKWQGQ